MVDDIILASGSPRRRQMLTTIGLPHRVLVSQVSEDFTEDLDPEEVAQSLAYRKAAEVAATLERGIVIGADTIVVLKGEILGKPADRDEAVLMLQTLSGSIHEVITGLAVIDVRRGREIRCFEITEVTFKELTEQDIRSYVETGEPMDKAGAYGIQELGGLFVRHIKGCYFNVVGLPLPLLAEVLKGFEVDIFQLRNTNKEI